MSISERIKEIRAGLPPQVRLVAVSKFHPKEAILEAYNAGQRIFGESRVQELNDKQPALPADIEWHFIGHLQSNKIKYIVPFVSLIHGVDSEKLLTEIDNVCKKQNRKVRCLLQIHIAQEESKFGFSAEECREFLDSGRWKCMAGVEICGLMGMATFTDDLTQIRREFSGLKILFDEIKQTCFAGSESFCELSMGMSDDSAIAIDEGSTLVRIGSRIFGSRQ